MEWVLLGLAVLLAVACGLFVAAEFSLVTVERGQVEQRAAAGERGATGVLAGLRTLSTQLSGAQLGITVTSLLIGYLAEPSLAALVRPGLEQAGLCPDRLIHIEAGDDLSVLACIEEGLHHGGLAAVVADVARLSMTASRRLHLAAKGSGTTGIALRRWQRQVDVADFGQARWLVELIRARAGESLDLELEACDGTGHLGHPAALADRPAQAAGGRGSAFA